MSDGNGKLAEVVVDEKELAHGQVEEDNDDDIEEVGDVVAGGQHPISP